MKLKVKDRLCAPVLMLALLLAHAGCWFGNGSATDKFAQGTYEVSGAIGEALHVVRALLSERVITPDQAIAATNAIKPINHALKSVVLESVGYLEPDANGKEVLVLTRDRQLRLNDLVQSLVNIAGNVANDPAITGLNSAARARITAVLVGLPSLILPLATLIKKAPVAKPNTPSLRLQVPDKTVMSFKLLLPQFDEFDRLAAEVR
jgi:hypothetical protein